jgi:hypothetical protein
MVPAAPSRKLIFLSVHPTRDLSSCTLDQKKFIDNLTELTLGWQKSKKNILKLFGDRNPWAQVANNTTDFFGVVAFELLIEDIGGFECLNSLIKTYSRMSFEANVLKKVTFESLSDMFSYYNLATGAIPDEFYLPKFKGDQIHVNSPFKAPV